MEINPSIHGWVEKLVHKYENEIQQYKTEDDFFVACQQSGLLYGYVVNFHLKSVINVTALDDQERTKLTFFTTLWALYRLRQSNHSNSVFIEKLNQFYQQERFSKFSLLNLVLPEASDFEKIEKHLDERIQINSNMVSKTYASIVTNALLFLDVLAFDKFLSKDGKEDKYVKKMEHFCISIVAYALDAKIVKSEYDDLLLKMFQNSMRYSKKRQVSNEGFLKDLENYSFQKLEKFYLLELVYMAMWTDEKLDEKELEFINKITSIFNLNKISQNTGLEFYNFCFTHRSEIPFFNYSHPVKQFYTNTQELISKLIIRNKNRLLKELKESKELLYLLKKSTVDDLSEEEKKKIKKQLLDLCKTVPSFTIFLLPGGGLLLPILIKFIPKLLPSAFNENLD